MPSTSKAKRTTLGDLMAAAKLGTISPDTEVITAADAEADKSEAFGQGVAAVERGNATRVPLSASEHECGIPGCKHGSAHTGGAVQPDRQVKLQCPGCGAVARMTKRALDRTVNGIRCAGDGEMFAVAERRTYSRSAA